MYLVSFACFFLRKGVSKSWQEYFYTCGHSTSWLRKKQNNKILLASPFGRLSWTLKPLSMETTVRCLSIRCAWNFLLSAIPGLCTCPAVTQTQLVEKMLLPLLFRSTSYCKYNKYNYLIYKLLKFTTES